MKKLLFISIISIFLLSCHNDDMYFQNDDSNHNTRIDTNEQDTTYFDTITPIYPLRIGWIKTNFSEDWDDWDIEINDSISGYIRTNFSEDWDSWIFNVAGISGTIKTNFSEDWDTWNLVCEDYNIRIETNFSDDWDSWKIYDNNNDLQLTARTNFSDDYDNWNIYNDSIDINIKTYTSEDWDYWEVYSDSLNIPTAYFIAASFIPIFTSSINMQGILDEE